MDTSISRFYKSQYVCEHTYKEGATRSKEFLEIIHTNIYGQLSIEFFGGKKI